MSTRSPIRTAVVAAASTLALAVPAAAQYGPRYPAPPATWTGAAYDNGYREGLLAGERDSRENRRFDFRDDHIYKHGDIGYDRRYGSREAYRDAFRRGYADGYRTGYERVRRRQGGWYPAPGGHPDRAPAPPRPTYPAYGSSPAYDRGFHDGYEEGAQAARDRDRYDPRGEKAYRKGDRGYDGRYGSKELYRREYREGFLAGYDRGYREGRHAARYPAGGWRWPW
jgi:hypothetical protein